SYRLPVEKKEEKNVNLNKVRRLSLKYADEFIAIHSLYEKDMYYTSQKILNSFSNWRIYGYFQNEKMVSVLYAYWNNRTMLEIYGIEYKDKKYSKEMAKQLLNAIYQDADLPIFCMVEQEEQEAFEEFGFIQLDCYHCYKKIL
ncbi:MAG: hypothetical protein K2I42_03630, partial [Anaeroplasmataceae bacterium]|nr:hypothetical protein [Anaeroplasmataceae bacterium]